MGRLTYINIAGKDYPMSFSLMASKKIAEKYGSIDKVLDVFSSGEITAEALEGITFILELLITQGCAYKNYFEKDVPVPDNAPVIDGKWEPLPKEALEVAIGLSDMETISEKLSECINGGRDREVAESAKKAKATRE